MGDEKNINKPLRDVSSNSTTRIRDYSLTFPKHL